jgi:hypothetical protein
VILLGLACAQLELEPLPDAGDWSTAGPGAPQLDVSADELFEPCGYLNPTHPDNAEHHNLVVMHDGYLLFPWAPEDGGGGISFVDLSEPCAPVIVGEAWDDRMRETHSLATGWVGDREYLAVDTHIDGDTGGIGFWDITDRTEPVWVSQLELPGYSYPDAYFRVALSTFWVGDVLYVSAGLLGVVAVDVSDPLNPEILSSTTEIAHLVGSFHVVGGWGMSSSAGLARFLTYDLADPAAPQAMADVNVASPGMELTNFYFASLSGRYGLFARKDEGGGPLVYDLMDPTAPTYVSEAYSADGDGGYVMRHEDWLLQGESNFGALYDFSDPAAPTELGRFELPGDLDTVSPIGTLAFVAVDEKGEDGRATGIFPWRSDADVRGPTLEMTWPADGETGVRLGAHVGLSFDELLEPVSVFEGSVRLWDQDGVAVPARFYVQEGIVNVVPDAPLAPDTTYLVQLPAGGVADSCLNPLERDVWMRFSTGAELAEMDAWPPQ